MAAKNSKQEIVHRNGHPIVRGEYYEGPFPHPDDLAKFESLQPGLVDRIFAYAETEQAQRHRVQNELVAAEGFDVRSGFWAHCLTSVLVTLMYVALLIAGCYALHLGHTKTALTIFSAPIARVMVSMTHMVRKNPETSEKK